MTTGSAVDKRDFPKDAPFRQVQFAPVQIESIARGDGTIILRSTAPVPDYEPAVIRSIIGQALHQPHKTFLAERKNGDGEWNRATFSEAAADIRAIGQWFLDQGFGQDTPVLILCSNSIAHAMVRLGAMAASVPTCPVSVNYGRLGGGFGRLKHVVDLVKPRMIFVEKGAAMSAALKAINLDGRIVVSETPEDLEVTALPYDEVRATEPRSAIDDRIAQSDPDLHIAYMLTSGSTGRPKAVIHTQRMQAANLHLAFAVLGQALGWQEVMLDWLPWSHVSGTSNLLAAGIFGGTLYIDGGKPLPGLFDQTIRNLKEVPVPYFSNVPAGFAMLADALEKDEDLCRTFFRDLRLILYGGAALPQAVQDRIQAMAARTIGRRIAFTTGYGATETCSGCLMIYYETEKVGIGLPPPGVEVKLVPAGNRYEILLRGDILTPGYLHEADRSAQMFDEEGFYRTGDSARFHDDNDPAQGLVFAGRLAEEFKLGTGTWVSGGQVRAGVIEALSPAIGDLVLCGQGRDYLAVLGIGNEAGLRAIAGEPALAGADLVRHPRVVEFVRRSLAAHNADNPGASTRIRRFAFLQGALDANRHEISDKGSVNQAMAMANRPAEVEDLYRNPPPAQVLDLD